MASRLQDANLRGTRAAQPLASAVSSGTLYYVTDEGVTERASNTSSGAGAIWETYSFGTSNIRTRAITFTIDGGGGVPTTGIKGDISVPYSCTINSVRLLADQVGSCVIDIWKNVFASYPPTIANTIVAAAPPTLSAANKIEDLVLSGWTIAINAGDTLRFNLNSVVTLTRIVLILKVTI